MKSITVTAPAKVNLFLKILSKRNDGCHNILTLFERISLADTIRISAISEGIVVKSDRPITRDPKDNLVYKAAELILTQCRDRRAGLSLPYGYRRGSIISKGYEQDYRLGSIISKGCEQGYRRGSIRPGVKIEIKKNIPIAAGLGGGSSDAAAVLKGVNKLFGLRLSGRKLVSLGKELGADVPFFLLDEPFAAGAGKGDKLRKVRPGKRLWHLLIYPGFGASTKEIYAAFDRRESALTQGTDSAKIQASLRSKIGYKSIERMLSNDLEPACVSEKKTTGEILEGLAQLLDRKFIVSGSGPSLFCLYKTGKEAFGAREAILRNVPARRRRGWKIFVARTF